MIALVTASAARAHDDDLPPLCSALDADRLPHAVEVWSDPSVTWSRYDLAILRSTWDYASRPKEFLAWIDVVSTQTTLLNPAPVLRWNTDKHYLASLAAAGVPIVPTSFFEPGDTVQLPSEELVIKPAIGAGSLDCARFSPARRSEALAHATNLLNQGRSILVQPYQSAIDRDGETALIHFDGVFSHAIRKGPILAQPADLVGGLFAREDISPRIPTDAQRAVASAALAAVPDGYSPLLYARVDLVPGQNGPAVLELELCEPSVFLAYGNNAAKRFAAAIASRITARCSGRVERHATR